MKSLDLGFLEQQAIPIEMSGLLQTLGELKGRQDLYRHQTPQVLESLRQTAIIESTESSNRIEGVTVPPARLKELMLHPVQPRDRSEAEIIGYREERVSPAASPDMIRVVLKRLWEESKLSCKGMGRKAVWEKRGNKE